MKIILLLVFDDFTVDLHLEFNDEFLAVLLQFRILWCL